MANFIQVGENEFINGEHLVSFKLIYDTPDGGLGLTICLSDNRCITIYDIHIIHRFFEDLTYHYSFFKQPDAYGKTYNTVYDAWYAYREGK